MRRYDIACGLLIIFLIAGCAGTVIEGNSTIKPGPTATLHPIFVPGGSETITESDMFSSEPITGTATTEEPIATPEATADEPGGSVESTTPDPSTPEFDPDATAGSRSTISREGVYTQTFDIPILMYHHINPPGVDEDGPSSEFALDAEMFLEQIGYLANNRFNTIDFYDLNKVVKGEAELPENPIILTFDDGYRDTLENALPILNQFQYTGTFFIATDYVDAGRDGFMNWDMVRQLTTAGHRVEPHSRTFAKLQGQDRDFLISQILGSQDAIAEQIGYTPRYFAYPNGYYDDATIEILEELGFWGAVKMTEGTEVDYDRRYEWPRLFVPGDITILEFIKLVNEGTPVDLQRELDPESAPPALPPYTGTYSVTLYNDHLDPNWGIKTSPGMRYRLQDRTIAIDGNFALSIIPQEDFSSLYFQVRPDTIQQYLRNQVVGVSFWLYSEEPIATNDLGIAISGSDDFPYWVANDGSVDLTEYDPIFDDDEIYFLKLNRAVEPETWTRVEILLDDVDYDTNYQYITGIHLRNNADFNKTMFIDQLELMLMANEE